MNCDNCGGWHDVSDCPALLTMAAQSYDETVPSEQPSSELQPVAGALSANRCDPWPPLGLPTC
jgi:hypothetical protein